MSRSCPVSQKAFTIISSSASGSSDDDETEDEISTSSRGRPTSLKPSVNGYVKPGNGIPVRRRGSQAESSGDSAGSTTNLTTNGSSFTRSRSPACPRQHTTLLTSKPRRHASPMSARANEWKNLFGPVTLLPAFVDVKFQVPLTAYISTFNVDFRKFGESLLLLGTLLSATTYSQSFPNSEKIPKTLFSVHYWLTIGE